MPGKGGQKGGGGYRSNRSNKGSDNPTQSSAFISSTNKGKNKLAPEDDSYYDYDEENQEYGRERYQSYRSSHYEGDNSYLRPNSRYPQHRYLPQGEATNWQEQHTKTSNSIESNTYENDPSKVLWKGGTQQSELLENTVVFMTNSTLDGFRGGDGDYMDKMRDALNEIYKGHKYVEFIRVVGSGEIPEDVHREKLISLKQASQEQSLQDSFFKLIDSDKYKDKQKIVYIGSRISGMSPDGMDPQGSGSLFNEELIRALKERRVRIIVNCLEYSFFKKSEQELTKLKYMLENHILHADAIQFLNQADMDDFLKDIKEWQACGKGIKKDWKPYISIFEADLNTVNNEWCNVILPERIDLIALKEKAFFSSGIFTVEPMQEQKDIDPLVNRPKNVLWLGLIRGEKGSHEAVDLAESLRQKYEEGSKKSASEQSSSEGQEEPCPKVILIGKVTNSAFMSFSSLILGKMFGLKATESKKVIAEELNIKPKAIDNIGSIPKYFFNNDEAKLNKFCKAVFEKLKTQYPEKASNIEMHFNISDEGVKELAMQCRYATKLDDKGMANNSSSIISCLGMYLPTFTSIGKLTGNEFKPEGPYEKCIIAEKEGYILHTVGSEQQKQKHQLVPVKIDAGKVAEVLKESDEEYTQRITTIQQLRKNKVFDTLQNSGIINNKLCSFSQQKEQNYNRQF